MQHIAVQQPLQQSVNKHVVINTHGDRLMKMNVPIL